MRERIAHFGQISSTAVVKWFSLDETVWIITCEPCLTRWFEANCSHFCFQFTLFSQHNHAERGKDEIEVTGEEISTHVTTRSRPAHSLLWKILLFVRDEIMYNYVCVKWQVLMENVYWLIECDNIFNWYLKEHQRRKEEEFINAVAAHPVEHGHDRSESLFRRVHQPYAREI
jgi:hypothetical protein